VERLKKTEEDKKKAEELGIEYQEPEEEEEEDAVPMITMEMLVAALKEAKRSVTPAEYQKYLEMKVQFDREAGVTEQQGAFGGGGESAVQSSSMADQAPSYQPSLQDEEDEDEDDIYS
jgi:hypothetical protein